MKKLILLIAVLLVFIIKSPAPSSGGGSGGGSGANFGVLALNTVYVSAATGNNATAVVGRPDRPYSSLTIAASNCPAGGTVAVSDGVFFESPLVKVNQNWVCADNTFIKSVSVASGVAFNMTGLAILGDPSGVLGSYFTNYTNMRLEVKGIEVFGSMHFVSTNTGAVITVVARDYVNFLGAAFDDPLNIETLDMTTSVLTNYYNNYQSGIPIQFGLSRNANKTYKISGNALYIVGGPASQSGGGTNTHVIFAFKKINCANQNSASVVQFGGNILTPNIQYSVFNSDIDFSYFYNSISNNPNGALLGGGSGSTNFITFQNCRFNLMTNAMASIGNARNGYVYARYYNCVSTLTNLPISNGVGFITNAFDNTVVDAGWTNTPYRY